MEVYNRFFIGGLLAIGLVGAYAGNPRDLPSQQDDDDFALDEALRILAREAAASATEYEPRDRANQRPLEIQQAQKRPEDRNGGMSPGDCDFTLNEALDIFARETAGSATGNVPRDRANRWPLEIQQAQKRLEHRNGRMSPGECDFIINEALGIFARETAASAIEKVPRDRANQRHLQIQRTQRKLEEFDAAEEARRKLRLSEAGRWNQMARQARRSQQQAFKSRKSQPRPSPYSPRPGSSRP